MGKKRKAPRILQGVPYDIQSSMLLITAQRLVDVGELCSMLQPPSGEWSKIRPRVAIRGSAALVSPNNRCRSKASTDHSNPRPWC